MAAPKAKVDMVKPSESPKPITVELIGAPNEVVGEHTLYHSAGTLIFIDGKAKTMSNIADELRKLGQVK